jgi:hypothetical protein
LENRAIRRENRSIDLTRLEARVGIEIEDCARCGGNLTIMPSIEEPEVIAKILAHLAVFAGGRTEGPGMQGQAAAQRASS